MKALFIYKFLTLGGVEAVLCARLEGLHAYGVESRAWFLEDGPGRCVFDGVTERISIGGLSDLQRHLDGWRPDVLTTVDSPEIFPLLRQLSWRLPAVIEVHTPYRENRAYLRRLKGLPLSALFVPTAYQGEKLVGATVPGLPVRIVPNLLTADFMETPRPLVPAPPRPVIAWVGRLDALKNWKGLLDTARLLLRGEACTEFWIIGSGQGPSVHTDLYESARRSSVLPSLKWWIDIPHAQVPRLLDAVRDSGGVALSTSRRESFGMAIAEAMARGCPVVVPDMGPFTELVEDKVHGRLYRPGSAKDAAEKVASLLVDHPLHEACGRQARERVLSRHSPDVALPILAEELRRAAGLPEQIR
jgi:glycosyltransferase involved in cell wall biosynthesis